MMAIDAQGISTDDGSMAWDELAAVSFSRLDAMVEVIAYLTFDHVSGHCLEVTDKAPGFQAVMEALDRHLPLPTGWQDKARRMAPGDPVLVLWRSGQRS